MAAPVPGSARPRPPRTASSAVPSAPPSAPLSKAPARPILVVDDDAKIVALVRAYLEREGFRVRIAGDGQQALAAIEEEEPLLIVLDVMLPEVDGMAVMRRVREGSDVPILMLSARGATADRIQGLAGGADDYLPKPFSPAELVARIKTIMRRAEVDRLALPARGRLEHDDLVIDLDRHELWRGGELIPLTLLELRLLATLVASDGRVLSRDFLLDALYGHDGDALDRTIDVHIGRLRAKLGDESDRPRYVATVRGLGYRAVRR
ncbi:MAG: response regulator transcription factor [Actinobacteria bacterium]|nr:MAG: response regulator transcription factor [Actinomycetota bacterium]